jgi:chemosensory pili system protein ChpA (sensor histidine kinase/response regulator)
MDDRDLPDYQQELSKDDQEVLRAFHELAASSKEDAFPSKTTYQTSVSSQTDMDESTTSLSEDDMLALFAIEADEDITTMRLAIEQFEQNKHFDSQSVKVLKRCAHKVAGTAASIGCASLSLIAHHVETIIKLVENGSLVSQTGSIALMHSVQALEATLESIVSDSYESKTPLLELEEDYKKLNIDVHSAHHAKPSLSEITDAFLTQRFSQQIGEHEQDLQSLRVDVDHLHTLLEYSETFIGLDTPMENAQKQVETALHELQFAQTRLRRLEPLLSSLFLSTHTTSDALIEDAGSPPSSLVARIMQEASERSGYVPQIKNVVRTQPLLIHETAMWDEMEIDRFSETNVLTHSLTEAITDVTMATSHVRQAFMQLKSIVAQQVSLASAVRNEAYLLQSLPFSVLVTRLRAAIETLAGTQGERIQFEVSGEKIEINQDVLEKLTGPLVELVQMYTAEVLFFTKKVEQGIAQKFSIWLNAHIMGNEATITIGFSQSVPTGAVALLQDTLHAIYGSVSLQEQAAGKITIQLRLPRTQRMIQGLLVRTGNQHVMVSVSQVKRIHFNKDAVNVSPLYASNSQDMFLADTHEIYHLNTALGFLAHTSTTEKDVQAALLLELDHPHIAIEVDEVVKEVELVMKPLSAHLCRPGITSTAIDGDKNVYLVLNLPEMIKQNELYQQVGRMATEADTESDCKQSTLQSGTAAYRKILIADDSIYIRQSISATLSHAGYTVLEAIDGLQALDQLSNEAPDLLLLDIEMPNLNGYDVLSIVRSHQEFSALKIVMLTSRSSEKHKIRARELGAHEYLSKPCSQDLLLKTIKSLLGDEGEKTHENAK